VAADFPHEESFGPVVFDVEIAAHAAEALGGADGLKPAGPVAGAAVARFIHETLDDQQRMPPLGLPIVAEPARGQTQNAGGQIGIAGAFGQDQEAAVIDDEAEASGALKVSRATHCPSCSAT